VILGNIDTSIDTSGIIAKPAKKKKMVRSAGRSLCSALHSLCGSEGSAI
jgi:hypothetical protein